MSGSIGRAVLACLAAVAFVSPTIAAAPSPVDVRVRGLRELGQAYKNVNDELKSGAPQMIILQLSARQIRDASRAQYGWFPAGSGPQPGLTTSAKLEIWTQSAQFKQAQDAFAGQAVAFYKAVAAGNVEGIRVQSKQLGGTCAACHRNFRIDDKR